MTGLRDFSSTRMVEDYDRMFYRPATKAYEELTADNAAYARALVARKERYVRNFDGRQALHRAAEGGRQPG